MNRYKGFAIKKLFFLPEALSSSTHFVCSFSSEICGSELCQELRSAWRGPAWLLSRWYQQLCIFISVSGWLPQEICFQYCVFTLLRERRGKIKALWLRLGRRTEGKKHLTSEEGSCQASFLKWKLLKDWKIRGGSVSTQIGLN